MQRTQTDFSLLTRTSTPTSPALLFDEIQATDPRCYRATRAIQAAWRAWRARSFVCFVFTTHTCDRCAVNIASQRVYEAHGGGRIWTCDACWSQGDHLEWDWEADDLEQRQDWRFMET